MEKYDFIKINLQIYTSSETKTADFHLTDETKATQTKKHEKFPLEETVYTNRWPSISRILAQVHANNTLISHVKRRLGL